MGDYTNLSIELDVDRRPTERRHGPDRTCRPILDPARSSTHVHEVPAQRRPDQQAVQEGARPTPQALLELREECAKPKNEDKDVCKQLNLIPGLPSLPGLGLGAGQDEGGGLPGIPGLPRAGFGAARAPRAEGPTMGQLMRRLRPGAGVAARARDGGVAMITRRTKIQLLIFVVITLIGVSFVGARYARLDRLVVDDSYTVVAHFADSGGIFAGGEVTYRGVGWARSSTLELTDDGVDVLPRRSRRTTTRSRPTPWRSSATGRPSASSTSSCSRRPTSEPYLGGRLRDRDREHPRRRSPPRPCSPPLQHGRVGRQGGPARPPSTSSGRPSTGPARTSAG